MADKKNFNLQDKIEEVTELIKNNKDLFEKFTQNPVKTLEDIIGKDLPDDKIQPIIDGIKAKISIDKLADGLNKLSGLFGKGDK